MSFWTDIYRELRERYDTWMGTLRKILRPLRNPVRMATEEEAYTMCRATRLIMNSVVLLGLSFPGRYVNRLGRRALGAFEKAQQVAPRGSVFRKNIGQRRRELERFLERWLPRHRPELRKWLKDVAPENLEIANKGSTQ